MATPKTGNPRGRPKGARNKRTEAVEERMREAAERLGDVIPEAFQGDAHTLLMAVYKDPAHDWPLRIEAAKAAIGYEKPKLASVDNTGDAVKRAVVRIPPKAEDTQEWLKHYAPKPLTN